MSRPKRSNYMGTLLKKPSGVYQARWMYMGKLYTKTTGEKDKRKALVALERLTRPYREKSQLSVIENLERELERLKKECAAAQRNMPVSSVYDSWKKTLRAGNVTQSTLSLYERYASGLVSWCDDNGVEDAHEMDSRKVKAFLDWLSGKVGATSFNQRLSWYKRAWKALSLDETLWDVEKMKVKENLQELFTDEEVSRMWKATEGDMDMRALLAIGLYTGMRVGDCAGLKWSSVDFDKGEISVVTEKTGSRVVIPLHDRLRAVLEKMPREGDYVSMKNGDLYERKRASERFGQFLTSLDMETYETDSEGRKVLKKRFHLLRHQFISMAIDSGMPQVLVQKVVGHAAFKMTEHYFHANRESLRKGIQALPDVEKEG